MRSSSALLAILSATCLSSTAAFWRSDSKTPNLVQEEGNLDNTRNDGQLDVSYGVDVSFPIQHEKITNNYAWLPHNIDPEKTTPRAYKNMVVQPLGDKQKFYDDFLQSCKDHFGPKAQRCVQNERDRIAMSLRQPQSMTNYTDIGFKKIRAPEKVFKLIKEFWDKNKDKGKPENWGVGNTYTNNWISMTDMVSVEDSGLRGGGSVLKQHIWDAARDTIQEWTGQELTQCSLYGIRVYHEGSILATHVDRLPLVSSAIINVDQDVDEPWPLEVYGHDGKATNVTMLPGDMVLYESHSVLHGRPFPLKGRFMANIFIHFEPTGHSLRHDAKMAALANEATDVHVKYKEATARGAAGHEVDQGTDGIPAYIIPGSEEEANWLKWHPDNKRSKQRSFATGTTNAHYAAQHGDMTTLRQLVDADKSIVHSTDANGWTPLHEGARAGNKEVVKFLFEKGADVNARTHQGAGGSVLWWVKKSGQDNEMIAFLESLGAQEIGPEL